MSQKANLLTLRKQYANFNPYSLNRKIIGFNYSFVINLIRLFLLRNIYLTKSFCSILENKLILNISLFFRTTKLLKLKKKFIKKSYKQKNKIIKDTCLFNQNLFFKNLVLFRQNIGVLNIVNLNFQLSKSKGLIKYFYKFFKKYAFNLFPRRFNFFIDSIKLTVLFLIKKISIGFYIKILGDIFKILQKRLHVKFLFFLKELFKSLILYSKKNLNISGIKFRANGKLRGKPRSSTCCILVGQVPNQSLSKCIDFSKLHVFTRYGVFGFKLWVYYRL